MEARRQMESSQFPGVGCACLCGDPDRSCIANIVDSLIASIAGLSTQPPPPVIPNNPSLPPSIMFFDEAFCDINADGACNVTDSSVMQIVGLPTQPHGGPFTNPPLPPSATLAPTDCIGYSGESFCGVAVCAFGEVCCNPAMGICVPSGDPCVP